MSIKSETDIAIIGLSGGADSTLVACLCAKALGNKNVYGIHMPYNETDVNFFNSRSKQFAEYIGIHSIIIPITKITDSITTSVENAIHDNLTILNKGNSRARSRMAVLYALSHHLADKLQKRVRVVGTGNLSEDFIGYDTKGGDALADFFPIGNLYKSQVYQMLDKLKDEGFILEEHIDRVPSAGLWEGQTDKTDIGYSYNEMQPIIEEMIRTYTEDKTEMKSILYKKVFDHYIVDAVVDRHYVNKHKHTAPKVLNSDDILSMLT
jgi:NAD+ synthase